MQPHHALILGFVGWAIGNSVWRWAKASDPSLGDGGALLGGALLIAGIVWAIALGSDEKRKERQGQSKDDEPSEGP